ncbi:MAG: HNH endonuclease [Selenomonadaceae bacterium]|nr:HNH endonuclease [Selenomonadaceae bacterium]
MKHKDKIFAILRAAAETLQDKVAVEELITKVSGNLPKIEIIDDSHQKFNGITYCKTKNQNGHYFKLVSMHRAVWTYFNGEIPVGYDIHHIDFDKENNDISNLIMLTKSQHQSIHSSINGKKTRKERKIFTCIACGQEFEANNMGHNLYCSQECCTKYAQMVLYTEKRICKMCGKEFTAYKYAGHKFCSHKCSTDYNSQQGRYIKTCRICGKTFSTLKHEDHTYCSPECGNKSRRRKETIICAVCGKVFEAKPSKHRKYCSWNCFCIARRSK